MKYTPHEKEIRYVDYGIGNRFNDCIELSKDLKYYPELHKAVLKHERQHTDKPITINDMKMDLLGGSSHIKELVSFIVAHPKAWTQFLPFYYSKRRGFVLDISLCILYVFTAFVCGSAYLAATYLF